MLYPRPARWIALVLSLVGVLAFAARADAERALVIYPGSFDPFHLAHRAELEAVRAQIAARHPDGVDVVVLPNHDQPKHIPRGYAFSGAQRAEIAKLSLSQLPDVQVHAPFADGTETVDQLLAVKAEHPSSKAYLLLGDDAYLGLGKWRFADKVLAAFHVLVSTPPARRAALLTPVAALGPVAATYAAHGNSWKSLAGSEIEPLAISVPEVRSHEIRLRLLVGRNIEKLVGARVQRALRTRTYRKAIEANAHALIDPSLPTIARILGADVAERAEHEGPIATALLALSNSDDLSLVRRVAHQLRRHGAVVQLPALQRLAKSSVHARIFKLPGKTANMKQKRG